MKGVTSRRFYDSFVQQVIAIRQTLVKALREQKDRGKRVAAYGASAKGSTLLNFCGLGAETIDFVADRSTYKQGRLTQGMHLPIVAPEQLLARQPDFTLMLTWNFADEILEQQRCIGHAGEICCAHPESKGALSDEISSHKTSWPYVIELDRQEDERGFFARAWCQEEFAAHGIDLQVVQCNISFNRRKGTLRGMHYQVAPHAEKKVVRCTRGAIYDVILDLRPESPTFKQWFAAELTAENYRMLYIPVGFAHGLQTLADDTEVFYLMSESYHPESARECGGTILRSASSGHSASRGPFQPRTQSSMTFREGLFAEAGDHHRMLAKYLC
jgi:dTDP-4-dehydrorhamnose 3,5-epimerase